jgi:predicted RNA-binding Zn-ribbon protein involved in translation (DUF1610 family)
MKFTIGDGQSVATDSYCPNCGIYMPLALNGSQRIHGCDRTPPLDGLPPTIYACPRCGGHGASRWGCWGTKDHPHDHAYMQPVHELVRSLRDD